MSRRVSRRVSRVVGRVGGQCHHGQQHVDAPTPTGDRMCSTANASTTNRSCSRVRAPVRTGDLRSRVNTHSQPLCCIRSMHAQGATKGGGVGGTGRTYMTVAPVRECGADPKWAGRRRTRREGVLWLRVGRNLVYLNKQDKPVLIICFAKFPGHSLLAKRLDSLLLGWGWFYLLTGGEAPCPWPCVGG